MSEAVSFEEVFLNEKCDEILFIADSMPELKFLAIDGRCASGKTTLAGVLAKKSGWQVVHLDDFFLRMEQRTKERYSTPGENVDWERLLEEVILPLEAGKDAVFQKFDCTVMALGETLTVKNEPPIIFEGSYSFHPQLRDHFQLKIFMDVNPEEQLERINARCPEKLERFRNEWIPLEEKYFTGMNIPKYADLYINTSRHDEI